MTCERGRSTLISSLFALDTNVKLLGVTCGYKNCVGFGWTKFVLDLWHGNRIGNYVKKTGMHITRFGTQYLLSNASVTGKPLLAHITYSQ